MWSKPEADTHVCQHRRMTPICASCQQPLQQASLAPDAFRNTTLGHCRQDLSAAIAAEGLQPLMRPDTPADLRELLESCWQLDPSKRPTAEQVEQRLQDMKTDGTPEPGTQSDRKQQLLSFWDLRQDSTLHTVTSLHRHSSNLQLLWSAIRHWYMTVHLPHLLLLSGCQPP